MALPANLTGLLRPAAYPHVTHGIRVVETHISWVLLTGDFAYKIKKPVRLPFVDFGSLERRRFFCREELRCNARFAPDLYLEVVPVCLAPDGMAEIGAPAARANAGADTGAEAAVVEWAVRMRQFPPEQELERLLEADELTTGLLRDFGARLGAVHLALPRRSAEPAAVEPSVLAPVAENFTTLSALEPGADALARIRRIQGATAARARDLHGRFVARLAGGYTRECHGDLHLGNLVLIDGVVTAFDCLEFDANLRWIDTQSDVAFLVMDCLVRGRADLAYAFLDGYLDSTGDYEGIPVLPFYAVYRAMVRAKVIGIQASQSRAALAASRAAAAPSEGVSHTAAGEERVLVHLRWAEHWLDRPPGRVVLMSGVSGSGKSYLAGRLAPVLAAVRIRSDVARRFMPGARLDADRYAPAQVLAVYRYLAQLLPGIVAQGESVIVDATFIGAAARRMLLQQADEAGWRIVILACHAPRALLEARIRARLEHGRDPSEADLAVLERQFAGRDPFGPDEPVLQVDTSIELDAERLASIAAEIAGFPSAARR